ncbi:MAG TPA: hypothetical protein VK797_23165 [Tepidisphaeraceae bacterium]|jgi:hypothetical protein|nr:hypothetical protein [Tepidisphaeraceae bacterium]
MPYSPGGNFQRSFITQTTAGVKQNADVPPTALLRHNGATDATVTVTITNNGAGDYTASGTLPGTYLDGDDCEIIVSATVGGTAGELVIYLGEVSKLQANLINALSGQTVIVQSPVGVGSIRIVEKDAYLAADGRALLFTIQPGNNWPLTLAGWTITFTATKTTSNISAGTATITTTGAVNVATGAGQQVQVELASSLTTGLAIGVGNKGYNFDVVATNGSDRATLVTGLMDVLPNVTA